MCHMSRGFFAIARGLALFISFFALLNVLGDQLTPGFDANLWWIDLRALNHSFADTALIVFSVGMAAWAIFPSSRWSRAAALAGIALPTAAVICNIVVFFRLIAAGRIHAGMPVPLSALVLITLATIVWAVAQNRPRAAHPSNWSWIGATIIACAIAFPLAQMYCFGKTDYRQQADVAVVFGARAYGDGTPSQALADRVRTACDLYRDGLVPKLIFSGGDGAIDEPLAMKRFAISLGVRPNDILLDHQGLNTADTIANTARMFHDIGAHRILAVSHAYHLPRVKMAYQRTGLEVYTVPAHETRTLSAMPKLMAREVAAMWAYYLGPLAGQSLRERA